MTAILLTVLTWASLAVHSVLPESRPALTYFLIPIAFGAATMGRRGGLIVTVISLVLARYIMVTSYAAGWSPLIGDLIEYAGLVLGSLIIVWIVGRLRASLDDLERLHTDLIESDKKLIESEERRIAFNREVLLAVTGSRIILCDEDELTSMLPGAPVMHFDINEPRDISTTRGIMREKIKELGLLTERMYDFEACTTEATTNCLKHAGKGTADLFIQDDEVLVLVADNGPGIAPVDLARATLEKGYSTRVSLGMGFKMMWELADTLAVCTSVDGTSILIRMGDNPPNHFESSILDRYPTLDV
jgi:anti-sigma regulatory factor (Ser/Thr protein kinase)